MDEIVCVWLFSYKPCNMYLQCRNILVALSYAIHHCFKLTIILRMLLFLASCMLLHPRVLFGEHSPNITMER